MVSFQSELAEDIKHFWKYSTLLKLHVLYSSCTSVWNWSLYKQILNPCHKCLKGVISIVCIKVMVGVVDSQ